MKNTLFAILGVVLLCSFCFVLGKKLVKPKVCFTLYNGNNLIVGVDNPISIVAEDERPIQLGQVTVGGYAGIENDSLSGKNGATITGSDGNFIVRVDSFGLVDFNVKTKAGAVQKSILATPIPVVLYFGSIRGGSLSATKFKLQKGVLARVECCGFDAKCEVVDYTIIHITHDNRVERAFNKGGRLNEDTNKLIQVAEPGDIYWFRNIRYRCPGTREPQLADDISVEIK